MAGEPSSTPKEPPHSVSKDGSSHPSTNKKEPKRPLKLSGSLELEYLKESAPKKQPMRKASHKKHKKHKKSKKQNNNNDNDNDEPKPPIQIPLNGLIRSEITAQKAFKTVTALLFILSILIFTLCIADMVILFKKDATDIHDFSAVNAIVMCIYQVVVFCFITYVWEHRDYDRIFWNKVCIFITLIFLAVVGILLVVLNFTAIIGCTVLIFSTKYGSCDGWNLSLAAAYGGIALVDAVLFTICAVIWYTRNRHWRNEERAIPHTLSRFATV